MNRLKWACFAGVALCALNACSSEKPADNPGVEESAESGSADVTSAAESAAPSIGIPPTPGMAFEYAFDFNIPKDNIARVQQEHAAACTALGVERCQITGMTFRKDGRQNIDANMSFRVDPAIVNSFGQAAIATAEKADGTLTNAMIAGEDVGTQIDVSQSRSAAHASELARIEGRLKAGGMGDRERRELQARAAELRDLMQSGHEERKAGEKRLAWTPVRFDYAAVDALASINGERPFASAMRVFGESGGALLSTLLFILAAFGPWVLAVGAVIWAMRRFRRPTPATPPTGG